MQYTDIISIENLFQAWDEFKKGKRGKKDVQIFERTLEDKMFALNKRLTNKNYKHGSYKSFYIQDPKKRHIHKAGVEERIVHNLLYKFLYGIFDKTFIYDSYSCRLKKGTHKAVKRLFNLVRKVSKNYTGDCWALKCDIKRFFATVDHDVLLTILSEKIKDKEIIDLLFEVIRSFNSEYGVGKGIPLGNSTSQVFANIYLNELDKFVKHKLKIRYYLRYADDFIILSERKDNLEPLSAKIDEFLKTRLKLSLHPDKIIFRKYTWGIDFLGYINLPYCILPRMKTKRRIFGKLKDKTTEFRRGKISEESLNHTLQSYLGFLSHANAYILTNDLKNQLWFWLDESNDTKTSLNKF